MWLQLSLYLKLTFDASGKVQLLLRNPERNQGAFTRVNHVAMNGTGHRF